MCQKYKITKDIIDNHIKQKQGINYNKLIKEIKEGNGGMKIAPGVTIDKYLEFYEDLNVVKYNPRNDLYEYIGH